MSGETWTAQTSDAETWVNVADTANGYVDALYVAVRYVGQGVGSTVWEETDDVSTTWA